MPLRSLFLDLNAFFASCEQQLRPELRGRPVAVVPMHADSTCVIAASYQAKKFHVKTGTRVGDAKRMCPGLVLVEGRHEEYIRFHHRIIAAVDTVIPVHKVCSIDEMECWLMGSERDPESALQIAQRVKHAIQDQVGECLTCSVGLAPNRVLAKIATDMQKPDGLVMIQEEELPQRLLGLKLRDLPGIGERMERRLNAAGIATMSDLIASSESELVSAFGSIHGSYWWHWVRGHDLPEIATRTRSIGHQHVLPPEQRNIHDARAVLVRLLHKAASRLRQKMFRARTLTVFVRCVDDVGGGRWGGHAGWQRTADLGLPTDDTLTFTRAFAGLWGQSHSTSDPADSKRLSANAHTSLAGRRILMVGLVLMDLEPVVGSTLPLFEPKRPVDHLGRVMDKVNAAFGKGTIYPASMHIARDSAPLRIAFSSIPDLDLPE